MPQFLVKISSVFLLLALALVLSDGAAPATAQDTASISGVVFLDTDMDGERDTGERPATGRTVRLIEYTDGEYNPETVTRSGSDGRYRFERLSANRVYNLSVLTDVETPCASGGYRDLSPGMDWSGQDLGVLEPRGTQLSGAIVNDLNENGAWDADEPGLADWTISLGASQNDGLILCGVVTESGFDGSFSFGNLPPFTYELGIEAPPPQSGLPWEITFPTKAAADRTFPDSRYWDNTVDLTDVDEVGGLTIGLHLVEGTAVIAGSVFRDIDLDGVRDAGEPALTCPEIEFFLSLHRHVPSLGTFALPTQLSCDDGEFEISHLEVGSYSVGLPWCGIPGSEEHRPQGPSQRSVTVREGERISGIDLAICPEPESATPVSLPSPVALVPTPVLAPVSVGDFAPPTTGSGGASSGNVLVRLAAALAVAGALALGGAVLVRRRGRARFRR